MTNDTRRFNRPVAIADVPEQDAPAPYGCDACPECPFAEAAHGSIPVGARCIGGLQVATTDELATQIRVVEALTLWTRTERLQLQEMLAVLHG
jgi:hypothetical protein